jgi:hypothetical protein
MQLNLLFDGKSNSFLYMNKRLSLKRPYLTIMLNQLSKQKALS